VEIDAARAVTGTQKKLTGAAPARIRGPRSGIMPAMRYLRLNPLPMLILAMLLVAGCASLRPVDQIREQADILFDRGEYALAADEYREIIDRYPGDWEAQYRYGLCQLELDAPTRAQRAIKIAHDRRPDDADIADALAEAIFRTGDAPRLYAFLRNRAESEGTAHAWLMLGRYSMELNDPDSARIAIDTAIAVDPESSIEPYLAAADLAEQLGDVPLAVRRLRQAYGLDPRNETISRRLRSHGEIPGPGITLPPGR